MHLYFAANSQATETFQKRFNKIVELLHAAGITIISNLAQRHISTFSDQELEKIEASGESLVSQVDGVIIEDSLPLEESGYLVAIALAHKKPILYLTEKNKPVNKNLLPLKKELSTTKLLQLQAYTDSTLEKIILDFLPLIDSAGGREVASIKFTLRITKRIERYLNWKARQQNLTKADYLRNTIEAVVQHDRDYEKFSREQN